MTDVAAAAWLDRWRARVTDCGPADRGRVEEGIRTCYREAGLPPPGTVAWVRSPREAERLTDAHHRVRLLDRLTQPRRGRWRRLARLRRAEIRESALRAALVLGALGLEASLTVVAAAVGLLPVVLTGLPAGVVAFTVLAGLWGYGGWVRGRRPVPATPFRRRRDRLRQVAHAVGVGALVLLLGAPVAFSWLVAGHAWELVSGEADAARTGALAAGAVATTAAAAVLGLLVGALLGGCRPSSRELSAVEALSELPSRLRRYPGAVPAGLRSTARGSVRWYPTGRDGRRPGSAAQHLQVRALGHSEPMVPLARSAPVPVADLLRGYELGLLAAADGRLVTAYADAGDAWRWWAFPELAVACERPAELVLDPDAARGGDLQLHRADGPALRWRDGRVEHWWHGVAVPRGLVEGRWGVRRIRREPNSEVRRAAVERMGWPEFIRRARLRLVSVAPDPGNPGRELRLYDLPRGFTGDSRLLVMTNGSPDRSGRARVYAETVPAGIRDPVVAAAWQYGLPVETYQQLQRRT